TLDAKTMTRNHARLNHFDRVAESRPNFHLLHSNIVTNVLFNDNKTIGVSYLPTGAADASGPDPVDAARDGVLAAGGFGTPKILQLSGIGSKKLLNKFNTSVVADLPGVGQNLQDQPTLSIPYTCMCYNYPTHTFYFFYQLY